MFSALSAFKRMKKKKCWTFLDSTMFVTHGDTKVSVKLPTISPLIY